MKIFETLGRNEFAAQLFSRKLFFLDQQHLLASERETDSGRGPCWAGTCNDDVVFVFHRPDSTKRFARECCTFSSDTPAFFAKASISSAVKLLRIDRASSSRVKP